MFDLISLIKTAGYLGLFGIVFAESGLFFGFFLPGDSLLFTAGFLASQGYLNIVFLTVIIFVGAVLGCSFGYAFGRSVGPALFKREDSILFHKDHLKRAQIFYERHGGKALIMSRFMPVLRTFAPILAGVGRMRYSTFLFYNAIGALIWAVGLPLIGFYLGNAVPNIDHYLIPIVLFIIVVSFLPTVIHILKDKEHRAAIFGMIAKLVK